MTREKFKYEYDKLIDQIEHYEDLLKYGPAYKRATYRKRIKALKDEAKLLDRSYYATLFISDPQNWWTLFANGFVKATTYQEKKYVETVYSETTKQNGT